MNDRSEGTGPSRRTALLRSGAVLTCCGSTGDGCAFVSDCEEAAATFLDDMGKRREGRRGRRCRGEATRRRMRGAVRDKRWSKISAIRTLEDN